MVDSDDVLFDDGAFVEVFGDEVRCGTNQFDSTFVGLTVRVCALEAGKERVVDVDDTTGELLAQLRAQHLHVTGENDQFNVVCFDNLEHTCFEGGFFFGGGNGHPFEGNIEELCGVREIWVVSQDQWHVNIEVTISSAIEKISDTVLRG